MEVVSSDQSAWLALFDTEECDTRIRETVIQQMRDKSQKYSFMVDGEVDTHMANMGTRDGGREIWATNTDISATAQCIKLGIMVMKDEQDKIVE